jgi:hypothetical protein
VTEPEPASAASPPPDPHAAPAVEASVPANPVCSVAFCPICMVVTALGEARPELVEHLLLASREMLLAVRAVIDAKLEAQQSAPAKLERLRID